MNISGCELDLKGCKLCFSHLQQYAQLEKVSIDVSAKEESTYKLNDLDLYFIKECIDVSILKKINHLMINLKHHEI